MQIKLTFEADHVLMAFPPLKEEPGLQSVLTSGFSSMVISFDDFLLQEERSDKMEFRVPVVGWRHFLRQLEHGHKFDYTRAHEFYPHRTAPTEPYVEPVYDVAGALYSGWEAVPHQADTVRDVGEFTLSQPEMLVIDPCYTSVKDGVPLTALPGLWKSQVLMRDEWNGFGVAILAVRHESVEGDGFDPSFYLPEPTGNAGVDSGTCGFFDRALYPWGEARRAELDFDEARQTAVACAGGDYESTRPVPAGNLVDIGVVSQTLIGDGGYNCFVRHNAEGIVVAACLVYDYQDPKFSEPEED